MSQSAVAQEAMPRKISVISWALYDLANTIFSMNIVSLYFSLWVINEMGGTDANYGNANSFSMFLMFISAPILGALSDQGLQELRVSEGSRSRQSLEETGGEAVLVGGRTDFRAATLLRGAERVGAACRATVGSGVRWCGRGS